MCGRYRLTRADKLANDFDAVCANDGDLTPRYNIAPTQLVPIVRMNGSTRVISSIRWGLIPSWAKDASMGQINARSETLCEKPAFRESVERHRCLIPADGFYEWRRSGTTKQPFHFGMKDGSLFAFAGIWDQWKPPEGTFVESCAILTLRKPYKKIRSHFNKGGNTKSGEPATQPCSWTLRNLTNSILMSGSSLTSTITRTFITSLF
jgi:putative SOS response-associated peptidase YedK